MYDRIVIPLDGSELAEMVIPHAVEMHRLTGSPVVVLRVVDQVRMEGFGPYGVGLEYSAIEPILNAEEQETNDYVDQKVADLQAQGIDAGSIIRRGSAVRELVAEMQPGDLYIMASHGRGGVSRFLMGSVAEDAVRHATVPVLLVSARAAA